MDNKILTLASLGEALVVLLATSKGLPNEAEVTAFKGAFDDYCNQPQDLDETVIKQLTEERDAAVALNGKYKDDQLQAFNIIRDLKSKLASSETARAANNTKPGFELEGVAYVVNHGAYPYSVDDIIGSEDIQKQILAIEGQQAIKKL